MIKAVYICIDGVWYEASLYGNELPIIGSENTLNLVSYLKNGVNTYCLVAEWFELPPKEVPINEIILNPKQSSSVIYEKGKQLYLVKLNKYDDGVGYDSFENVIPKPFTSNVELLLQYSKSKHSAMITEHDEIVYVSTHLNNRVLGLTFEKIK